MFKRLCSDGRMQIIYFQSCVGTGSTLTGGLSGGAFGAGLSEVETVIISGLEISRRTGAENMREVYAFICANYFDGDAIVLAGFSR